MEIPKASPSPQREQSLPAGCSAPGSLLAWRKGQRNRATWTAGAPAFSRRSGSGDAAAFRFPSGGSEWGAQRADTASEGGVRREGRGTGNLSARVNNYPSNSLLAALLPGPSWMSVPQYPQYTGADTETPIEGGTGGRSAFAGEEDGEHPSVPARLRACVVAPGSPRRAVLRGVGRQPQRRRGSPQGQRRQWRLPGLTGLQRQRPDAPLPHRLHPRADRPAGEGVLPGELRVQAPEM